MQNHPKNRQHWRRDACLLGPKQQKCVGRVGQREQRDHDKEPFKVAVEPSQRKFRRDRLKLPDRLRFLMDEKDDEEKPENDRHRREEENLLVIAGGRRVGVRSQVPKQPESYERPDNCTKVVSGAVEPERQPSLLARLAGRQQLLPATAVT